MVEKLLDNNRKCYWFGESVCDLCADQSHMFTARVTCDWANSLIEVRLVFNGIFSLLMMCDMVHCGRQFKVHVWDLIRAKRSEGAGSLLLLF